MILGTLLNYYIMYHQMTSCYKVPEPNTEIHQCRSKLFIQENRWQMKISKQFKNSFLEATACSFN